MQSSGSSHAFSMEHLPSAWQNQALLQQMYKLVGMQKALPLDADPFWHAVSRLKWAEFAYIVGEIEKVFSVVSPCDDYTKLEISMRVALLRDKIVQGLESGIFRDGQQHTPWRLYCFPAADDSRHDAGWTGWLYPQHTGKSPNYVAKWA
jgi:hypothetical protein